MNRVFKTKLWSAALVISGVAISNANAQDLFDDAFWGMNPPRLPHLLRLRKSLRPLPLRKSLRPPQSLPRLRPRMFPLCPTSLLRTIRPTYPLWTFPRLPRPNLRCPNRRTTRIWIFPLLRTFLLRTARVVGF